MGKRILVVDDESTITELIDVLLSGEGFEVSTASDGSKGLEMVDNVNPDLIITDISMPDMEGVEFISRLRKRSVSTPIIAMSGNAVGMNFLKATKLFGATETILKPFSTRDLIAAVRRSLALE
ncbi:MAG TPA: response regulator [Spirochaetia bacterium]|nr:response regulator [Spirochaetia bacterium]